MMNQTDIEDFLTRALDEQFDVHAILNQLVTRRMGEAQIDEQNKAWQTNRQYLFAIKMCDECLDPTYWRGPCIAIVQEKHWKNNRCLDDQHISGKIHLPDAFGEAMESTFDYAEHPLSEKSTKASVSKQLTLAGFRHSQDLEDWFLQHDP